MESLRSARPPRFSSPDVTAFLLALGTALLIYWQPLTKTLLLKASDAVFVAAVGLWLLSFTRGAWVRTLRGADLWFIPALLASIVVATVAGYVHYHLGMSRTGTLLLGRLLVCILLFLATYSLLLRDTSLRRSISLAFLSPLALFPALLIPGVSAAMWDSDGRFQGLTLNANTAAMAFLIAFALAYTLGAYETGIRRRLRAVAFFGIAAAMLVLIVWTQSRAYLIAAFGSALLGTVLVAKQQRRPNLRFAVAAVPGLALVVVGILVLAPGRFAVSYLTRVSPIYYRTVEDATASQQTGARNSGPHGPMSKIQRFSAGILPRLEDDIRTPAIRYYAKLLSTNVLGLGVNYESKFTVYHAPTRTYHGTNTILDLPVYGGVGAVLSVAYLALLIGRKTRRTMAMPVDANAPYTMAAVTALGGLWGVAVLVGSPLFDYQFWILTAIVLA
jgi:hypothetical protein